MYFCLAAVVSIIIFAKEIIIQTVSKNKSQPRMPVLCSARGIAGYGAVPFMPNTEMFFDLIYITIRKDGFTAVKSHIRREGQKKDY